MLFTINLEVSTFEPSCRPLLAKAGCTVPTRAAMRTYVTALRCSFEAPETMIPSLGVSTRISFLLSRYYSYFLAPALAAPAEAGGDSSPTATPNRGQPLLAVAAAQPGNLKDHSHCAASRVGVLENQDVHLWNASNGEDLAQARDLVR
jgi:hypothetical protein